MKIIIGQNPDLSIDLDRESAITLRWLMGKLHMSRETVISLLFKGKIGPSDFPIDDLSRQSLLYHLDHDHTVWGKFWESVDIDRDIQNAGEETG